MYHGCGKVRNFAEISNYNRPCNRQHKELGIVLNQKLYSDFKFVVNGKEFYVHKCILSACSPVFTAILQSNMTESSENKMEITDVDADVMEECLNFIYTGQVKDIQKFGKQLLVVADKYEIKALKTVCEDSIINSISIENFGEMLIFVDTYKADSLLFDMGLFFVGNAKEIITTEGFKTALKSCPLWVTELIKTLVCV